MIDSCAHHWTVTSECPYCLRAAFNKLYDEYDRLHDECLEQARLNGMGAEREAALSSRLARIRRVWTRRGLDQEWHVNMDLAINGSIFDSAAARSIAEPAICHYYAGFGSCDAVLRPTGAIITTNVEAHVSCPECLAYLETESRT